MNWKRVISRGISELYLLPNLITGAPSGYRVLMYHSIGGQVMRDNLNIYSIEQKLFQKHMDYLSKQSDLSIVDFSDDALRLSKNSIAITFDDGYKDNLYVAAPIMEELKLPYTVFVSTGFIKSGNKNFLSAKELRTLSESPYVNIGSHGVSHDPLAECSDKQLKNELVSSKHYIEDIIGKPVLTIGYPHGSVDQRVKLAAKRAGYQLGGTSYMDINHSESDKLLLARTSILGIDTMRVFEQKINGRWDWYKFLQSNPSLGS